MNNASIAALVRGDSKAFDKYVWLAEALEARAALLLMLSAISEIGQLLDGKPQNQLSRLERSMLSKRNLSYSKDSTQPLESFLIESSRTIGSFLDNSTNLGVPKVGSFVCYIL